MINDITPATNKWAKQYAHLEYRRIVWHDLWDDCTYIPVVEWKAWHNQLRKDIEYIESFK